MIAVTAPMQAQTGNAGQVELGAFGSFTRFDQTNLGFANELGGGGWLGLFLKRWLSIEAAGDYTRTTAGTGQLERVSASRIAGLAVVHLRAGFNSFYLGAGYERAFYRGAVAGDQSGVTAVLGDRLPLGGRAALRIEARASLHPSPQVPGAERATNLGVAAGISIFSFGGPPRDADADGVVDRRDDCADTPFGATVTTVGCPSDSDTDGYLDGLDQCPDTPGGATVDNRGCPSDGDTDGVLDGIDVCPDTPGGANVDQNGCPSDSDSDGVLEGIDQCAGTPAGAAVDDAGCPTDQDADGVFDGLDQCPDTPADTEVDALGCTIDRDEDDDGVLDSVDRCPQTPAGIEVDQFGCPVLGDDDGDGVNNSIDRCPGTQPGQQVDAVGCPVLFLMEEGVARPLVLQGVNFRSGRSSLTEGSYGVLDEVAQSLVANPEVRIEIAGHTDATGSRQRNMELSLGRAIAVRTYLAQRGVTPDRMVARGYGPDQPIATNGTRAGRAQNRRVELHLIEGGND